MKTTAPDDDDRPPVEVVPVPYGMRAPCLRRPAPGVPLKTIEQLARECGLQVIDGKVMSPKVMQR